jgi:hypothetical protein
MRAARYTCRRELQVSNRSDLAIGQLDINIDSLHQALDRLKANLDEINIVNGVGLGG